MTALVTANQVQQLLSSYRFRSHNEAELQEAIEQLLTEHGLDYRREVVLTPKNRIDFMVGRIGIEIKVGHPLAQVIRQLHRYAQLDAIDELVLVSNRCRHAMVPEQINGKAVAVVFLSWGSLG